jgi:hypothetical protein
VNCRCTSDAKQQRDVTNVGFKGETLPVLKSPAKRTEW